MSVPVGKRGESKLEYKSNFYKIYNTIFYYTAKDFGIKPVVRDLKVFTNNAKMSKEDADRFKELCNLYGIGVESSYPQYILEFFRNEILRLITNCLYKITEADSVFPGTDFEFNLKKQYQHEAISSLECVLQIIQRVIHLYPVNEEKYVELVTSITNEIELLRKWKKRTNSIYRNAKESKAKKTSCIVPIYFNNNQVNGQAEVIS